MLSTSWSSFFTLLVATNVSGAGGPPPRLLDGARSISIAGWSFQDVDYCYRWLAADRLLLARPPANFVIYDWWQRKGHRIDSFAEEYMSHVNTTVGGIPNGVPLGTGGFEISPGGRWALCDFGFRAAAIPLSDGQPAEWSFVGAIPFSGTRSLAPHRLCWLDSNGRWVRIDYAMDGAVSCLGLYDIHKQAPVLATAPPQNGEGSGPLDSVVLPTKGGLRCITAYYIYSPLRLHISVQILTYQRSRWYMRRSLIPLPLGRQMTFAELVKFSRDSKRIAWLLTKAQDGGAPWELWVSNSDGTDMREIGYIEPDTPGVYGSVFESLQWEPSGRRVSFIHARELYSVSVQ